MVLNNYRAGFEHAIEPLVRRLARFDPNVYTWLGLVFAFAAAYALYASSDENALFLLIAALLITLSSGFDAVDGAVARMRGIASKRGDFLDHVFDRYSDVALIAAIALSPWCSVEIGLFALLGVLLTSYMGTQAQAVGLARHYGGMLGRAERLVLLIAASVLQYAVVSYDVALPYGLSVLAWLMVLFAVVGNITAVQRALTIWRELDDGQQDGQKN